MVMLSTLSRQRVAVVTVSQMTHIDDLISRSAQAVMDSAVFRQHIEEFTKRNCPFNAFYAQSMDVTKRGQTGNRHLATQTRILPKWRGGARCYNARYLFSDSN